jgi:hypothetical protein
VDDDYTVTASGVKEDLLLGSSSAPSSFDFAVTGGATITADASSGSLDVTAAGKTVGSIPTLTVSDSAGVIASSVSGAMLQAVVVPSGVPGSEVSVSIDPDWLAGLPASAFPVYDMASLWTI